MTSEEAINTLGNFLRYISGNGVQSRTDTEAIHMAIEALKEQKPKPVRYEENTFTKLPVSFCPKCGEHIDMYLYGRPDNSVKFCPYCGQAVDWIEDGEQE